MKGASAESGAALQSYAKNGIVALALRLSYDNASGYYTIASLVSGKYVGTRYIEPYSTAPGGAVVWSGFLLQRLYATDMDMGIYSPYNHRWLAWQTYNSMNWYNSGTFLPVSVYSMQRGDVIYYRGHIAIYLGDGRMIDSWPRQGVGVHGVYECGNPIGAARPFV